ncbi:glycosyltransferase [Azospirillum halopraeferens]|uniref:glycosyltransferase family protein n=1 Tax=Azospirillum halopraeferens TaxID=34010 RepID=UPI00040EA4A9|nr:glycosyltransferase [Azospirillum halopraeferens]
MKIVNVGNFDYKGGLKIFFHTARKLSHGLARLGHAVFDVSDRDLARQEALFGARKLGVGGANRLLLDICRNVEPDLVLLGHADVIRPGTLAEVRRMRPSVRIAQWNYDALYLPDNIRRIAAKLDVVDATLVTTAGAPMAALSRPGRIVAYMPNPVDAAMETGRSFAAEHEHDLFFGMRNPRNVRRWDGERITGDELARRLRDALPGLRLYLPGLEGAPPVYGMDYVRAIERSLMGLSLSQESDQPLYASDRMAHLTANGTLTFVDRATGFDTLYRDDELAFYASVPELIEKLRHYHRHPMEARAVAERGWARTHAMFDSRRVARYLLEQVFREPLSEGYEWPTETV